MKFLPLSTFSFSDLKTVHVCELLCVCACVCVCEHTHLGAHVCIGRVPMVTAGVYELLDLDDSPHQ